MRKKIILFLLIALILTACGDMDNLSSTIYLDDGISTNARIIDNQFQVYKDEDWNNVNIKSINLKNYIPGINTEIDKDTFEGWIEEIANLNANTIKLDDLFPAAFYEALYNFNRSAKNPIYIIQSIPMDLDGFKDNLDPFKLDNSVPYKNKISSTISALHGDVIIPKISDAKNRVSGEFKADVSPYVSAWILGSPWSEEVIKFTNDNRQDKEDLDGNFIATEGAKPFEIFIADMMEHALEYEFEKYNWMKPIGFTNQIRDHKIEDDGIREFISINPDVIGVKNKKIGYFVAYDMFPSYPSYMNTSFNYTMYLDHRGDTNNYSGFLNEFISGHKSPVFIGSFGAPSSRGISSVNTSNFNQGQLSEVEQGNMIGRMYEDIIYNGAIGGSIEAWQDDWNQEAWNIAGLDNENRRKIWSNVQNTNQHFGLVKFGENKITLDGSDSDWIARKIDPIYTRSKEEDNIINKLYLDHDQEYLYFALELESGHENNLTTNILIDSIEGQGNSNNPFNPKISSPSIIDFIVNIDGANNSRILVDSYYDVFHYINNSGQEESDSDEITTDNETTDQEELIIDKKSENEYNKINTTVVEEKLDGQEITENFSISLESGRLKLKDLDLDSKDRDSLADYCYNEDKSFLEIRLPWALLNFSDPSSKEIIGDFYKSPDGIRSRINIDGIKFAIAVYDKNEPDKIFSLPENKEGKLDKFINYKWDSWNEVDTETNFKDSYEIIQELYRLY